MSERQCVSGKSNLTIGKSLGFNLIWHNGPATEESDVYPQIQ